jgi:enoyl-CoA hydratase/carnithine racemase
VNRQFGPHVQARCAERIGWITLDRPARLNAFAGTMRDDLDAALREIIDDPAADVVVITGAGRGFCAGADLDALHALARQGDEEEFGRHVAAGMQVARTIRGAPKLVIAAVNGVAAGAGASLAAACDLRIASSDARIGFSFTRIGLHPDWGASYTLPRLVGEARAAELVYTARLVDAQEALSLGLVDRVVPAESFPAESASWARELAAHAPRATRAAKRTFGGTLRDLEISMEAEAAAQLACFRSGDLDEGIRSVRERRTPIFECDR